MCAATRLAPLMGTGMMRRVRLPLFRVTIAGPSMLPVLVSGEWWLGIRTRVIRPGDLVVFRREGLTSVKRVVRAEAGGWWVEGDNAGASIDSRRYGPIELDCITGRLVLRLRPWSLRRSRSILRNNRG